MALPAVNLVRICPSLASGAMGRPGCGGWDPPVAGRPWGGSVRGRRIGRAGGWTAFAGPMLASPRGRMGDVMSPC